MGRLKIDFGTKFCQFCGERIELKIHRDLVRKKYCGRSCRQKGRFLSGEWSMDQLWEKNNTPEVNKKKANKGEKNPRYITDRTKLKCKRTMLESREGRKQVFIRDNYTCKECGTRGGILNADHIKSWELFPDLRFNLDNGRTLCLRCHKNTPSYARKREAQIAISQRIAREIL